MSLKKELKLVWKAGFTEKNVELPDKTVIHYAEGPNLGNPPLVLIHGQTGAWQSYAAVLPELSKRYHVYAIDCHGHGGTSKNPEKYTAKAICSDIIWLIHNVVGSACTVSGHSSGGLITAMLAAKYPDDVTKVVLEDPPFFSTVKGERWEKSFAYVDTYAPIHAFLQQSEEKDWIIYYLKHALWGTFVGAKGMDKMISYGVKYRKKHPGKPLNYFFLPDSINRMFWFMDDYDLKFGDRFYDSTWFEDYDQERVLAQITCPAILIHTKWSINEDGILMAAMSEEDAQRANHLMANSKIINIDSGHESHHEKPLEFIASFDELEKMTK